MMPFPDGPVVLECLHTRPDDMDPRVKRWWKFKRVKQDWSWESRDGASAILVKAGTYTDGASIPPLARSFVGGPFEEYADAAVGHDYLYEHGSNRGRADYVLLEIMRELPTPKWKRFAMTAAVRVGGWWPWYKARRKRSN